MPHTSDSTQKLSWDDMLQELHRLLASEAARLEKNKTYYRIQHKKTDADKQALTNLYNRIAQEQQQLDLMNECLSRFESRNLLPVMKAIDFCEESELKLKGKIPDNFQLYITKKGQYYKTYYMPLSDSDND